MTTFDILLFTVLRYVYTAHYIEAVLGVDGYIN